MSRHALTILIVALIFFSGWSVVRMYLVYRIESDASYPERIPRMTDVEIHSLSLKVGRDFETLVAVGVSVSLIAFLVRRRHAGDVLFGASMASALALGMAYYPALVLSGRLGSPLRTVFSQSAAYSGVVLLLLLSLTAMIRMRLKTPT
jgi:hypothetical protein